MKKSIKMGLLRGTTTMLTICICTLVAFAAQGLINRPLKTSVFGAMPVISSELEELISVNSTGQIDDGTFPYIGSGQSPFYDEEYEVWSSSDGAITTRNKTYYAFSSKDGMSRDITVRVELTGDGVEEVWPQAYVGIVVMYYDSNGGVSNVVMELDRFYESASGTISTIPFAITIPAGNRMVEVAFTGMHSGVTDTTGVYNMTLVVEPITL